MKQIILGTAGHIDHGKTTLIKVITGVNTDRLKEEKLRGITIELGFAALDLPSGQRLGIVDVPGHEKFVKNMVAGATGIDLVAMVIAADEGIMPQTREHMEICTLLGIQYGLVVITKTDLVDAEWLELVREEVAVFTHDTFLETAPVVPLSAASGDGLNHFMQALDHICQKIPERKPSGLLRLPVDRVFSMKGFGTVITGTLISGQANVGDRVMLYPAGVEAKIRGLQVHNQSVDTAQAGMRTAINFQGIDKQIISRGHVVATPHSLKASYIVDVNLRYLASNTKPIKNRTQVRFHAGTSELLGILVLLDRNEAIPGEKIQAQIRLKTAVTLVKDDHYVLRSYSPIRTIGGGVVLNPIPGKHKRFNTDIINHLKALASEPPIEIARSHIERAGYSGRSVSDLLLMTNLPEKQLNKVLQTMMSQQDIIQINKDKRTFIHRRILEELQTRVYQHLKTYHDKHPLKSGMPKEELKSKLPANIGNKLFSLLLNHLIKNKITTQEEDILRLYTHQVTLGVDQQDLRHQLLSTYKQGGLTPPYFKQVLSSLKIQKKQALQMLALLLNEGLLIKIKEDLYYHHEPLHQLKQKLVDYLATNETITTPQFKDMTGASRKFVIPLIEYFDTIQLTIRVADVRKLRKTK